MQCLLNVVLLMSFCVKLLRGNVYCFMNNALASEFLDLLRFLFVGLSVAQSQLSI